MTPAQANTTASQVGSSGDERRVLGKTLVVGLALLGVSILAFRGMTAVIDRKSPGFWMMSRVKTFVAAIPALTTVDSELVVAFGSSPTQFGFDSHAFERKLAESGRRVVAINAGMPWINPRLQAAISGRMAREFRAAGKQIGISLVEFTPFQSTIARKTSPLTLSLENLAEANAADWTTFGSVAKHSLEAAAEVASIRVLLGGVSSAELIRYFTQTYLTMPPSWWMGARDMKGNAVLKQRYALADAMRVRYPEGVETFTLAGRGFNNTFVPETERLWHDELLPRQNSRAAKAGDLRGRQTGNDIDGLHFDQEYLSFTSQMVRDLAGVSRRTYIYVAPRNRAWVKYDDGAKERLRQAIANLREATGVEVIDLSEKEEFDDADFMDVTHLNPVTGTGKLVEVLVRELMARQPQ